MNRQEKFSKTAAPDSVAGSDERVEVEGFVVGPSTSPPIVETTPSGIEIAYYPENKEEKQYRHYEIRSAYPRGPKGGYITGDGQMPDFVSAAPWQEVPSVTTIVDKFKDPGGLIWWGMRVGIEGTLECLDQRHVSRYADAKQVEQAMIQHKLTTNHVKDAAGSRGTNVHKQALEMWAETRDLPDPSFFSPEEEGYVVALRMFLLQLETGKPEVVASERMVGSLEHGFAGRYDLEVRTTEPCIVAKHWTPKRGPQWATLQPGHYVLDLKTSKGVNDGAHIQLAAYELARQECGYPPSDATGIIHVHPGDSEDPRKPDMPNYSFVRGQGLASDFLATKALYDAYNEMHGRMRK